jgi:uncharacterized cupredoxin-like copper-binding protein
MRHLRAAAIAAGIVVLAASSAACAPAAARPGVRTVHVTIHFSRFDPEAITVRPGETVTFVVENTDPIDHEFVLGDDSVQLVHELGTEAHHPPRPGEMSVPAQETAFTTHTFSRRPSVLIFGCHLPGHYAFGMRGTVTIA